MKDKTIESGSALLVSLVAYLYAKKNQKDTVPFVMLGGFIGSLIGEIISEQ